MTKRDWLVVAGVVLAVGGAAFMAGRFSVKPSVMTHTITVEKPVIVEKPKIVYVEKKDERKNIRVERVTQQLPDGSKTTTVTRTDTSETKTDGSSEKTTEIVPIGTEKRVEKSTPVRDWRATVLGGYDIPAREFVWGGAVDRTLAGPVRTGIWGMSNGSVGASLSVEF